MSVWLLMMKVSIEGKKYQITAQMMKAMPYFQQFRAIYPDTTCFEIQPSICSQQTWLMIVSTLERYNFQLPKIGTIKSNVIKDYLPSDLSQLLQSMDQQSINKLYSAAHFLKIADFRRCIAAFFACKAFVCKSKGAYQERAEALKVSPKLTVMQIDMYREKELNLN